MSRILFKILLTALLVTSTNLYAHSYHSHGKKAVSEEKAILSANASVKRLVTEGKLEKSWSGIKHSSIEKKTYTKKKKEWLVVYKNMDVKDSKKQSLYVFLSISGKFIAANHTGK